MCIHVCVFEKQCTQGLTLYIFYTVTVSVRLDIDIITMLNYMCILNCTMYNVHVHCIIVETKNFAFNQLSNY